MQRYRWFFLLLIAALLLPGCQTADTTAPDTQAPLQAKVNPLTISISSQQGNIVSELEESECLNCHSDKQHLIDTAKVEEVAESESSGVG